MSAPGSHNRIITLIAREILRPHGFQQKGRSRFWFLDLGWWLILVEFQPSGWDRGTYLNVAAMFLWHPADYYHFDYGPGGAHPRIGHFTSFENEEQFAEVMRNIARGARDAASDLRRELSTLEAVARRLEVRAARDDWAGFHAGAALALAGRRESAVRQLRTLAQPAPDDYDWVKDMRARAARFADTVEQGTFLRAVSIQIQETRQALKLPPWDGEFTTRFRAL